MRGLWKLPELWTRKQTRDHKLLGRRRTDAGAHSYHSPRFQRPSYQNGRAILSTTCLGRAAEMAGFDPSMNGRFSGVHRGRVRRDGRGEPVSRKGIPTSR
jgi:hypothetical protein